MNKFCKISLAIFISVLIFQITIFSQESKQSSDSVSVKKHNPNDCLSMVRFFSDAISFAGKNGGLALLANSCPEEIIFPILKPNELPLDQRLNLVIQKYPKYRWKYERGSINLLPSKGVPKILKTRIKKIEITFTNNLGMALDAILRTPEIIKQKKKLRLHEGFSFGGLQSPPSKKPPTIMVFYKKTLQEILNELARKTGYGIWIYQEGYFNNAKTFIIDFTRS